MLKWANQDSAFYMYLKKYGDLDRDEKCIFCGSILLWNIKWYLNFRGGCTLQTRYLTMVCRQTLLTTLYPSSTGLILTSHPWTRYIIKIIWGSVVVIRANCRSAVVQWYITEFCAIDTIVTIYFQWILYCIR